MSDFDLAEVIGLLQKAEALDVRLSCEKDELVVKVNREKRPDAQFLDALRNHKVHLLEYFRQYAQTKLNTSEVNIPLLQPGTVVPLSFAQERLWFMHGMQGDLPYRLHWLFELNGQPDIALLENAFRLVMDRHEVLRTTIREKGGVGFAQLLAAQDWQLHTVSAASLARLGYRTGMDYIHHLSGIPFDLTCDYMLRVTLVETGPSGWLLSALVHHIAFDGWSIGIMVRELVECYNSLMAGRAPLLSPLPIRYSDYAAWQRDYLQGAVAADKLAYWCNQLSGVSASALPADYARPARQSGRGGAVRHLLDPALQQLLQQYARSEGVTLFMLLLAAFKVLLYRYSRQEDICVGTPIAGRQQQETEGLIGFFINTLALRSRVDPQQSFAVFLQQVKQCTLSAYEHQDLPFEKIVQALGIERDPGRSPLFQVVFALHNTPESAPLQLGSLALQPVDSGEITVQYDLDLNATGTAEGIVLVMTYCSDLYKGATVVRLLEHYEQLLRSALAASDTEVAALPWVSAAEQQLLAAWNDTGVAYPVTATVTDLFAAQVQHHPMSTALVMGEERMCYRELDAAGNRLANYLIQAGVVPGTAIGLLSHRGMGMLVGIWGILKAGGIYVPLNMDYPASRLQHIATDAAVRFIVHGEDCDPADYGLGDHGVLVEVTAGEYYPDTLPLVKTAAGDGVYIMYTSGTTGKPKGILVTHTNIIKLVSDPGAIRIFPDDHVLQWSNYAFDGSVYDIFGALLNGACLHLIGDIAADVYALGKQIEAEKISISFFTTALFNSFADACPGSLAGMRRILVGGEQLSAPHVRRVFDLLGPGRIVNGYGPTETTVFATCHVFDVLEEGAVPIGKPLGNTRVLLLDGQGNPVPIGVEGELYIGGAGVAAGYVNNEALSLTKFVNIDGARYYRSGDIVRWNDKGELLFTGRMDGQVKLRGYRIELGEIEAVLLRSGGVRQAVVLLHTDEQENKRLAAFVVTDSSYDSFLTQALLRASLPEYMVPGICMVVPALPLTGNGKVDHRALLSGIRPGTVVQERAAPRTETEKALAVIWEELLDIAAVGIHDDFFDLGGHSLLAVRVLSAIRSSFGKELAIRDMFDTPTIAGLAALISNEDTAAEARPSIRPGQRPDRVPLSFAQERLWFMHGMQGDLPYRLHWLFELNGQPDIALLENAFRLVMDRHEVLRTTIREKGGVGFAQLLAAQDWQLHTVSAASLARLGYRTGMDYIHHLSGIPFDLTCDYMLRVTLVETGPSGWLLSALVHHIAFDGWSIGIMVRELVECYNSLMAGRAPLLSPLPIRYSDYAAWQRDYLQGAVAADKLAYWCNQLSGVSASALPADYARPARQSGRGGAVRHLLDPALQQLLQQYARSEGVTLFMLLLAAFKVLLYRYSRQEDICVGTPIAGRQQQETEGLIGFFINTLALRSRVDPQQSFAVFLQQVKQCTLSAYEHQDLPFEKIVQALGIERDPGRSPLFQVVFALHNTPESAPLQLGSLALQPVDSGEITVQYDLDLNATGTAEGIVLVMTYCSDLYKGATVVRLLEHYEQLLRSALAASDTEVAALPWVSAAEQQLLAAWNDTGVAYPVTATVTDLFAAQVQHHPMSTALVMGEERMCYRELDAAGNRLANYLIQAGVVPGTAIGLLSHRGMGMLVGIWGILKAGGIYVPLNMDYPASRLQHIATDAAVRFIVHGEDCDPADYGLGDHGVLVEVTAGEYYPDTLPLVKTAAGDGVYIMYTSGTTGKPKGILVTHTNIIKLVSDPGAIRIFPDDHVLQWSNYAFDGSVYDIFGALLNGACLHLIGDIAADVYALGKQIEAEKISISFFTTALFNSFADACPGSLAGMRRILVGGEQLSAPHVRRVFDLLGPGRIVNGYGPTETTVFATCHVFDVLEEGAVPIGKPLGNTRVLLLDGQGNPVPIGVEGELYIGGAGVAAGYVNNEALSLTKFVNIDGARYYRSGDIVRWNDKGELLFTGRMDGQVKLRGYRIELGEIEAVLLRSGGVRQAVVLLHTDEQENKRLAAFVVTDSSYDSFLTQALLRASLPEYMVPGICMVVPALPLTGNGKVDHRALLSGIRPGTVVQERAAPRTETEKALAVIWEELLDIAAVGIHDDFFDLGGHSLLAVRVLSAIRSSFGKELTIRDMFDTPTIAGLAALISNEDTAAEARPSIRPGQRPDRIPLSYGQERLWFIDNLLGSVQYHMPWLFRLRGALNITALENAFRTIVNRHEVLRTGICSEGGKGYQVIFPEDEWRMDYQPMPAGGAAADSAAAYLQSVIQRPMVLATGHKLWVSLVQVDTDEYLLLTLLHHIAFDGWSIGIMVEELVVLYRAMLLQQPPVLKSLPVQYADYAVWQRRYLAGKVLARQLAYWKENLAGVPISALRTDWPRPPKQSTRGRKVFRRMSKAAEVQLNQLSLEESATPFMTLLTLFKVLLYRYSGQADLCMGTPVAGRQQQETEGLIGFFVNTLVLRNTIEGQLSFRQQLRKVRQQTLTAYEHQEVPFEKVVEALGLTRDLSRSPIFQVTFAVENLPGYSGGLDLEGVTLSQENTHHSSFQFDLGLNCIVHTAGLLLELTYCEDLFSAERMDKLLGAYEELLQFVPGHADDCIDALPVALQEIAPAPFAADAADQQLVPAVTGNPGTPSAVPVAAGQEGGELPLTALEQQLVAIWQDVLELDRVDVQDNFFEKGGYSIVMIQLLSQLTDRGFAIQLQELYTYPTIRAQAALIAGRIREAAAATRQQMVAAHALPATGNHCLAFHQTGSGTPIFILPGSAGFAHAYDQLAKPFSNTAPVYGLHMPGVFPGELPGTSIEAIAAINIQYIKSVYPEGPCRLIGHSFGGHVAFEVCRQLEANGETVEWVAVFDIAAKLDATPITAAGKVGMVLATAAEIFEASEAVMTGFATWGAALEARLAPLALPQMAEGIRRFLAEEQGLKSVATDQLLAMLNLRIHNMCISSSFTQPIRAPLLIARAADALWEGQSPALGWEGHSNGGVAVLTLPGGHHSMCNEAGATAWYDYLLQI